MRQRAQGPNGHARVAVIAIAALSLSVVGVGLAGSASAATTRTVGCDVSSEPNIQQAVDDSASGDTVQVCAGTYGQSFTDDDKDLTFLGPQHDVLASAYPTAAGEAVIDGGGLNDPVIEFFGGSTLNGFTVKDGPRGIIADAGSTIRSNSFKEVDNALEVGDNVVVSENTIAANDVGVSFFGASGSGTEISDNRFAGAFSERAIDEPGGSPDDDHVTNLSVLRNAYTFETGGGGFFTASHTTGLRIEGNVLDGAGGTADLIQLSADNFDWSVKANKLMNVSFDAVDLDCNFGSDNTGSGAVTQNLFSNVGRSVRVNSAGGTCSGTLEVHSNVFGPGDGTASSDNATVFNAGQANVNVENNFWGCNAGPGQTGCSTVVSVSGNDRYLVLQSSIGTKTLSTGQSTPFTANLNHNNVGETIALPVLDGTPVSFTASTYLTVTPISGQFTSGVATATVKAKSTPGSKGIGGQSVSGHVENATTTQSPITVRPSPPVLSVLGTTTAEGRTGTHVVYFAVTLSHKFDKVVTVKYATANGTAKAPADFVAKSGTLTFSVGATTGKIGITIKGDKIPEANESYFVTLFSPVNATVSNPNAVGIIRNS
jgi:Calx-beta domain